MIRTAFLIFAFVAATAIPASAGSAYLSRSGGGVACTFALPCNNIQQAITVAGPVGEVVCLDKGYYQSAFIQFSITISCGDGLWEMPFGSTTITTPAGAVVVIEGFNADGNGIATSGLTFDGQGTLHLHRVRIGNTAVSSSHGLRFVPNGPGTLHVSNSVFYNNGGSGIHVRPTGGGFANLHIRDVKLEHNGNGLFIDGSASTVGVNANVTASVFADNSGNGIGAFSTGGAAGITVSVKDSQLTGNVGNGVGVLASSPSGAGSVTVEIGNSMIAGNVNGVSASGAGQIRTFGNNQLRLNGNNGAFTGSVGLQ